MSPYFPVFLEGTGELATQAVKQIVQKSVSKPVSETMKSTAEGEKDKRK